MSAPRRTAIAGALAAAALTGCGTLLSGCSAFGSAPTAAHRTTRSAIARAQATHEYPAPAPAPQIVAGASAAGPLQAIRSFATRYINWQANTVAARMRLLAAQSVGQARSATLLAAANSASDYELQRDGIANSGTVEAIAPLSGHPNEYVVVTRERTTATGTAAYQGLRPAWHIAVAAVVELRGARWAVSRWQPES